MFNNNFRQGAAAIEIKSRARRKQITIIYFDNFLINITFLNEEMSQISITNFDNNKHLIYKYGHNIKSQIQTSPQQYRTA